MLQSDMTRLNILFFFLFCWAGDVLSQTLSAFSTRNFTTENGLPANGIKGLQWDEESGFLWIATEAGISRFNGLDFKNYTKDNTPFIVSERMLFLVRNNKGKIYTADQTATIMTISHNKLEFFGKYRSPGKDFNGKLFTISISDTLYKSKNQFKGRPFSLLYDHIVPINDTACYIIQAGKLFYLSGSMEKGIHFGDTSLVMRAGFKLADKCFISDRNFNIYVINKDTLISAPVPLVNEDGSSFEYFNKGSRLFWTNRMDNPVMINGKNAWQFTLSGNKIEAQLICDEIPTDALIEYIQYSPEKKMLFLGTDSKGIIVMSRNRLTAMKSKTSGSNVRNAYYSQVELTTGNVLTNEGHVIGKQVNDSTAIPIKGKFGNYISNTNDSLLWYCKSIPGLQHGFLHRYNRQTGITKQFLQIKGSEIIVKQMSDRRLLLVTEFGIGLLEADSIRYLYSHPGISYDNVIYDNVEIHPGIILLAGCSGILRFDLASKKLDTVLKSDGYCVRSIWKYKDYIFFGTYGKGFFAWKNGVLKSMPVDKNKYLLYTHCFAPDEFGFCWISTNRGLFKVNMDELTEAYEKNTPIVYYHYFGKSDGMDMIEMNGGCLPCALHMQNKTISFPTMDGLLWVDPAQATPMLPEGNIYIDEFQAGAMKINPDSIGYISIPYTANDIQMKLVFSAWCNKENIYIDYQLNNIGGWIPVDPGNEAIIRLNNLSPGNYTVTIRKLNGFGANNYSFKKIKFSINVPWHRQWWFYLLCVLAGLGAVALYLHVRTRQYMIRQRKLEQQVAEKTKELQEKNEVLEKNNTIKTKLISIISHDIITPLKFLTAAGRNLLEKRQLMDEEMQQETIREITNTSQELQLLSTNILNWIKYQNENRLLTKETFNVHEMVNQVLGILNSLAQQKKLRIINEIDTSATVHQYYEPLKILVYNLLTNAINFSEKGTIAVRMEKGADAVVVTVKDEGVGMTPEKIQSLMENHVVISSANVDNRKGHGLGFLIIKDLLKTIEATLHIESKLGTGSTISIIIPV